MTSGSSSAEDVFSSDVEIEIVDMANPGKAEKTSWLRESFEATKLAVPVIASFILMMATNITTGIIVGRQNSKDLGTIGICFLTMNVTGNSFLVGLSSALGTLGSQAFGAQNFARCGILLQRCIVILCTSCIFIGALWLLAPTALRLIDTNETDPDDVQAFMRPCVLSLIPNAVFVAMRQYLQMQGLMWPITHVQLIVNIIHVGVTFLFVNTLQLGLPGAAYAYTLTQWSSMICMLIYFRVTGVHKKTWPGWSRECLKEIWPYLKLAVPGAGMVCLEWWGFEIITLISTKFGAVTVSSQTILNQTIASLFMIPLGFQIATSVRVGQLLGSNEPDKARIASRASLSTVLVVMLSLNTIVCLLRHMWASIFVNDEQVSELVAKALPLVLAFNILDSFQTVAGGTLSGMGKQSIGAALNLTAYWIIALPLAYFLGVVQDFRLLGLWIGIGCGVSTNAIVLSVLLFFFMDFKKSAEKAQAAALGKTKEMALEEGTEMIESEADDRSLLKN